MNIEKDKTINVTSVVTMPRYIGEIKFNGDADITRLPFSLRFSDKDGSNGESISQPTTSKQAPLFVAVSADAQGKWRWCKEGSNIGLAYLMFGTWASNQKSATDWYTNTNASITHTIPNW